MRPVTDRFNMSREKLSYLIDATAAPVCIIAPISSWAASVMSYYPESAGMSGMTAFLSSIPMNLYAILTIFMIFYISLKKNADYGPMLKAELLAEKGIHEGRVAMSRQEEEFLEQNSNTKRKDLRSRDTDLIPHRSFDPFDALRRRLLERRKSYSVRCFPEILTPALLFALGAFVSLIFAFIYFMARRVLTFKDFFQLYKSGNQFNGCSLCDPYSCMVHKRSMQRTPFQQENT